METIGVVLILIGLALAFCGYRIFKVFLAVTGFFAGAGLGFLLAFISDSASTDQIIIYMLIGGIAGTVIAKFFYSLGVFITAGGISAFAFYFITASVSVALLSGIVCGVICCILEKYAIIFITVAAGSILMYSGIAMCGTTPDIANIVVTAIIAMAVQLFMDKAIAFFAEKIGTPLGNGLIFLLERATKALETSSQPTEETLENKREQTYKFCAMCGAQLSAEDDFCGKCGYAAANNVGTGFKKNADDIKTKRET